MTPLIYAADQGFDDMCIYLSLRTKNIDQVCEKTGKNILVMYIIKKNKVIINQLLMRGANINFVFPFNGFTPLHWAIQEGVNSKIVKFLIKQGAYEHAVDKNGLDCCDKALQN